MIVYFDTSALVKKYFMETGSAHVISMWKKADGVVTSSVAYAETMAAFHRKYREAKLPKSSFTVLVESFKRDWASFHRVELTDDLNEFIDKLVRYYPLRGFDAIHLASALVVHQKLEEDFLFLCFDEQLLRFAKKEGLNTSP
jgi:predicted nucleic acid-binding protein